MEGVILFIVIALLVAFAEMIGRTKPPR